MQTPSDMLEPASTIQSASARAFIYRFLAKGYEYPEPQNWSWLSDANVHSLLRKAVGDVCSLSSDPLSQHTECLVSKFASCEFSTFLSNYHNSFGHTARGSCPLNEIEYGDLKADPLFQPHRLADLAAFYHAFGLEITDDAAERQDHISIECEFMSVLTAKEVFALENTPKEGDLAMCLDSQKKFLKEHIGRWIPAFTRKLAQSLPDSPLAALANFTRVFIERECRRFNISAGHEDLLLRSINETEDSLCDSCGINSLPPGATTSGA